MLIDSCSEINANFLRKKKYTQFLENNARCYSIKKSLNLKQVKLTWS